MRCELLPPLTWLRGTAINTPPPPRLPPRVEREAAPPRCERLPPDFAPDLARVLRRERVPDDAAARVPVERFRERALVCVRLLVRAPLRAVLLRAAVFLAPVVRERLVVARDAAVRPVRLAELRVDAEPRVEVERRFELEARLEPVRLVERAVARRPEDELGPVLELRERAFVLRDEVPREPDWREPPALREPPLRVLRVAAVREPVERDDEARRAPALRDPPEVERAVRLLPPLEALRRDVPDCEALPRDEPPRVAPRRALRWLRPPLSAPCAFSRDTSLLKLLRCPRAV